MKGSKSGADPELDFGGSICLFHEKSFLILLFTIGNIAVWWVMPSGPLDPPLLKMQVDKKIAYYFA